MTRRPHPGQHREVRAEGEHRRGDRVLVDARLFDEARQVRRGLAVVSVGCQLVGTGRVPDHEQQVRAIRGRRDRFGRRSARAGSGEQGHAQAEQRQPDPERTRRQPAQAARRHRQHEGRADQRDGDLDPRARRLQAGQVALERGVSVEDRMQHHREQHPAGEYQRGPGPRDLVAGTLAPDESGGEAAQDREGRRRREHRQQPAGPPQEQGLHHQLESEVAPGRVGPGAQDLDGGHQRDQDEKGSDEGGHVPQA